MNKTKLLLILGLLFFLFFSCKKNLETEQFNYHEKLTETMKKLEDKSKYVSLETEIPIVTTKKFNITNKYIIPFLFYELERMQQLDQLDSITKERIEDYMNSTAYSIAVNKILYEVAVKNKVSVTKEEVDEKIMEISNGDPDTFKESLTKTPFTWEFVYDDLNQILNIMKYQTEYLTKDIKVEIQEIEDYYKNLPEDQVQEKKVKVRHILIRTEPGNDAKNKTALSRIKNIQQQANAGQDFAALAQKYSEDPGSQKNGGLLNEYIYPGQTVPEFEKTAFKTEKGQISDIVETMYGYHVLKVEDKVIRRKDFQDMKEEITKVLTSKKESEAVKNEIERIEKDYKIEYADKEKAAAEKENEEKAAKVKESS